MFNLFETLSIHKKTVLFGEGGFNVNCVLRPDKEHQGFSLTGFSTFTGCTFSKDGQAFFGDSFELTLDLNSIREYTQSSDIKGWCISVAFPQINNKEFEFLIESAPIDRLMGTVLLKCSKADNSIKQLNRNNTGGI